MNYVKSLKDTVKRRFAGDYLVWIRNGRTGPPPLRGALSATIVRTVMANLDALG